MVYTTNAIVTIITLMTIMIIMIIIFITISKTNCYSATTGDSKWFFADCFPTVSLTIIFVGGVGFTVPLFQEVMLCIHYIYSYVLLVIFALKDWSTCFLQ